MLKMEVDMYGFDNNTGFNGSSERDYNSNQSGEFFLKDFVMSANKYFLPFIIITGFIGNGISGAVFLCSRLRRISTSVYLAALAASDTGFLFCLGFGWLDVMGQHLFHTNGICQIVVYMTFIFSFTSVWYVNAFTLEMYIAVFHPTKGAKVCTPGFARNFVIGLTSFACVFYSFALFTAKITSNGKDDKCMSTPNDHNVMMVLSIMDTFLTLLLPFSMIIFMTTRLLIDISRVYRKSDKQDQSESCSRELSEMDQTQSENAEEGESASADRGNRQGLRAQSKLKQMLVVVIIVFLVLNLPSHAIRVQFFFRSITESQYITTATEFYSQHLVQILYYVNFAVNFVLYSACANSFRAALIQLCQSGCNRGRRSPCFTMCRKRTWSPIGRKGRLTDMNGGERLGQHPDSRLVEIHLSEIHFSQIPSFDSQYVCQSPPCLITGRE